MSKKISDYIAWLILAAVAFAVCSAALLTFSWIPVLWTEPAAAWVQAVGSIVAIGVAIWVSSRQHSNDLEREANNERSRARHLLESIHDEVDVMVRAFLISAGTNILKTTAGIEFRVYISRAPFKVYNAHIGSIGTVPTQALRTRIIETYTHFDILLLALEMNNDFFAAYDAARTRRANDPSEINEVRLNETAKSLIEHGTVVRETLIACEKRAQETLAALKCGVEELR